jgi:hypothetical protein
MVQQAKHIASVKGIAPIGLFGLRFVCPLQSEEIQNEKATSGA